MARTPNPLGLLPTFLRRGSHRPNQAQLRLLPRQLRHGGPLHPLPQPPLAAALHDRLPNRPLLRLVLPLLLPRPAPRRPRPNRRRPIGAHPARRRHVAGVDFDRRWDLAERAGLRFNRARDCRITRRVSRDRGFVLGRIERRWVVVVRRRQSYQKWLLSDLNYSFFGRILL
ncbi:hypothetical protein LINGRAHAP2_LOCUS19628 [Linum grandiflorum]